MRAYIYGDNACVHVRAYMCICACESVCVRVCLYVRLGVHVVRVNFFIDLVVCECMHGRVCEHANAKVRAHVFGNTYAGVHVHTHISFRDGAYVCVYVF